MAALFSLAVDSAALLNDNFFLGASRQRCLVLSLSSVRLQLVLDAVPAHGLPAGISDPCRAAPASRMLLPLLRQAWPAATLSSLYVFSPVSC